jgi:acyl-coenzyme A thioesterase PaaI-like protein
VAGGVSYETFVEEQEEGEARLRFVRPAGEAWDSATLLALVDAVLRAAAGQGALTHLNVTVLKPAQDADVVGLARVIKRDGGTVHAEAWLFSHAVVDLFLHATATLRTKLSS